MSDRDEKTRGRTGAYCPNAERQSTHGASLASRALVAVYPDGKHVHGVDAAEREGFASWRRWVMADPCDLEPLGEHDRALLRSNAPRGEWARTIARHDPAAHSPLEVVSLADALTREWAGDAHMLGGVLHTPDGMALARQPRVNHGALEPLQSLGFSLRFGVVFAEADRGDKRTAPWSEREMQLAADVLDTADELEGLAWHFTRGGLHVLGVLEDPTSDPDVFARSLAWLRAKIAPALARIPTAQTREHPQPYLVPDEAVKDWTRLFRLPLVVRDGERQPWGVDLSRLAPLAPAIENATVRPARRVFVRPGVLGSFRGAAIECPAEWVALVPAIARAMRDDESNWNSLFLYIAGALCESGVPTNDVPAIVQALSSATGRDDRERFETCGAQTARKASSGEPYAGMRALEEHSPAVARALADALRQWSQGATRELPGVDDARRTLRQFFEHAPYGASIAAVGTGIGKSHGAIDEAERRAQGGYNAAGVPRSNTRTGIAAPTTELARELFVKAAARGIPVARLFSPVALEQGGSSVCRFERRARSVARAGLSIYRELCDGRGREPCVYRDECAAAQGFEVANCGEPKRAFLVIGPHALAGRVADAIGETGMLFIDEPPHAIEETIITRAQLALLQNEGSEGRGMFEYAFAHALAPVVDGLAATLDGGELAPGKLCDFAALGLSRELEALASVDAPNGPPVRPVLMARARVSDVEMERIERVCSVARLLHRVASGPLTTDGSPRWTVGARFDRHGARLDGLVFTGPQQELEAALQGRSQVVFLDAAPDVDGLARLAGYPIKTENTIAVLARDAHPVERAVIEWRKGTRTGLNLEGEPDDEAVANGLRVALRWALEDPTATRLLLVTFKRLREHIERALMDPRSPVAQAFAAWLDGGRRSVDLLHYGNVRGYDEFREHDVVITFGTPRDNMDAVDRASLHLGIDPSKWAERADWLVRRELEQAHGRLRFPSRSKPARALHMGELLPLGVGWDRAAVLPMPRGRAAVLTTGEAVEAIEREGSQRAAARAVGVGLATIQRALERGTAGDPIQLREEDSPTKLIRVTPPTGAKAQSAAENMLGSAENGAGTPRVFSVPISAQPGAARVRGRPATNPTARMEASAMTTDELEVAIVKLTRTRTRAELAAALGCSDRALRNYAAGDRAIPAELAAKVREMLAQAA
ncbi:MAG: hypothetical protein U0269_37855 [Polyangiales bacterium]